MRTGSPGTSLQAASAACSPSSENVGGRPDIDDGDIWPLGEQRGERGESRVHRLHDGVTMGLNKTN